MNIKVIEEHLSDGSTVFDVMVKQNGQVFRWHCPNQQAADAFRAGLVALVNGLTIDGVED